METTDQTINEALISLYKAVKQEYLIAGEMCDIENERGYICTRALGHLGQHIATGGRVCDIWGDAWQDTA
jgi:hypothetical protein